MSIWPSWLPKWQARMKTSDSTGCAPGTCEICGQNAIVWLDGKNFFCWDHYTQEMQRQRGKT